MPTYRRTPAAALALASAAVAVLTACGNTAPRPWLTDDLYLDPVQGRYYTTCEDPGNERHEKHVWLTDEQAATHAEGQPCPAGELRTPPYWQAPGVTVSRTVAPRPPKSAPSTTRTTTATTTAAKTR
ncbi:hypothetical protein [Amycolatopsis magusensis]|uniref:hypothetical protein n=1 Tax=Amycolatopsis magusensis TaxID=882444 RepID=UPI00379C9B31